MIGNKQKLFAKSINRMNETFPAGVGWERCGRAFHIAQSADNWQSISIWLRETKIQHDLRWVLYASAMTSNFLPQRSHASYHETPISHCIVGRCNKFSAIATRTIINSLPRLHLTVDIYLQLQFRSSAISCSANRRWWMFWLLSLNEGEDKKETSLHKSSDSLIIQKFVRVKCPCAGQSLLIKRKLSSDDRHLNQQSMNLIN